MLEPPFQPQLTHDKALEGQTDHGGIDPSHVIHRSFEFHLHGDELTSIK